MRIIFGLPGAILVLLLVSPCASATAIFNSGSPDGRLGSASRPASPGKIEIESADDFILTSPFAINHATFVGLLTGGTTLSSIASVDVEIYRVFPLDSTNPPSGAVPTRVNSPSDDAFSVRDSTAGNLSFTASSLGTFTAANSILNGIHPLPGQNTGGEGSISGTEVLFDVTFTVPFALPSDHYFFVPQVELGSGEFYWLSVARPITGAGTTPFTPDLQSWIRNQNLDPNWLRMGTDIVGGTATFNAAFTLDGTETPEPSSVALVLGGLLLIYLGSSLRVRGNGGEVVNS
jgi:hypothetical protein